jgi:hypothetical protein
VYPELAEDLGYLAPLKLRAIGSTYSGPQDLQSTATNDTDFSVAFNGIIAKVRPSCGPRRSAPAQHAPGRPRARDRGALRA